MGNTTEETPIEDTFDEAIFDDEDYNDWNIEYTNTPMIKRICITGERITRKFYNIILEDISKELLNGDNLEFIFGDCTGVDANAKEVCKLLRLPYTVYAADWKKHGLAAGPIRNKQMIDMLEPTDEVWAYHTDLNKSKGTKNTVNLATKRNLKIVIRK